MHVLISYICSVCSLTCTCTIPPTGTIAPYLHLGGACLLTGSFKDLLYLVQFLAEMAGGCRGVFKGGLRGLEHPPQDFEALEIRLYLS